MNRFPLIVAFGLLLLCGCAAVPVTPATLVTSTDRPEERDASLKRWREAVNLCNAFLESPYRKTLPPGEIWLTDDGMEFVADGLVRPINIRCTYWGDVLVWFGMAAQERSDGFVVGLVKSGRSRLLDNSFFKYGTNQPNFSAVMAELTLHELTHSYYQCGTVSFTKGMMYYLEAVFLFRYRNHSMERLPFKTSGEFESFYWSSIKEQAAAKIPTR
jgi:hypothetical protein